MVDTAFTPYKPPPAPKAAGWCQWAVILAMLLVALVPWTIVTLGKLWTPHLLQW